MIGKRFDVARAVRQAIVICLVSSGSAWAQSADGGRLSGMRIAFRTLESGSGGTPVPDCPQIRLVCALIADPAIRSYVGLAEYAWDFNAADRALRIGATRFLRLKHRYVWLERLRRHL